MKMSDTFPLPLDIDLMKIGVESDIAVFDCTGGAAVHTVHAVNNYDALVEALGDLTADVNIWNNHGYCNCCGGQSHRSDCSFLLANTLLDDLVK